MVIIFYKAIRLLLLHVYGPKSFNDLKSGKSTFMDSAIEKGLMTDDSKLDETIHEAMREIRSLTERIRWFAVFIANQIPKDPNKLLENHFDSLSMWPNMTVEAKKERLLKRIEIILRIHGIRPDDGNLKLFYLDYKISVNKSACEKVGLPRPKNFEMTMQDDIQSEYFREEFFSANGVDDDDGIGATNIANDPDDGNTAAKRSYLTRFQEWHKMCTDSEQRPFVDAILAAAEADPRDTSHQRYFFLTGEGGTGKTFVYNVTFFVLTKTQN